MGAEDAVREEGAERAPWKGKAIAAEEEEEE